MVKIICTLEVKVEEIPFFLLTSWERRLFARIQVIKSEFQKRLSETSKSEQPAHVHCITFCSIKPGI